MAQLESSVMSLLRQHATVAGTRQVRKVCDESIARKCGRPYELAHLYDVKRHFFSYFFSDRHACDIERLDSTENHRRASSVYVEDHSDTGAVPGIANVDGGCVTIGHRNNIERSPPRKKDIGGSPAKGEDATSVSETWLAAEIIGNYEETGGLLETAIYFGKKTGFRFHCSSRQDDLWIIVRDLVTVDDDLVVFDEQMRSLQITRDCAPSWCKGLISLGKFISDDVNKILRSME
ncbi:hypothetical protein TWF481_002836 [Arthrobotrys musiformis]|uniref:SAWADEE domain-containing protein n=1 Tax=Arthrobotrys musiformis TaxID=47236 RepID=A0AAV9VXH9_9PEZI